MDSFGLGRFIEAQRNMFERAMDELKKGEKAGHWIWYIFPQLKALGRSSNAKYYGISGLEEAKAYLADPVLGPRLVQATEAVLAHKDKTALEIFGDIDTKKLCSCMTLFRAAAPDLPVFNEVIKTFYRGQPDWITLGLLGKIEKRL